jgi:hypothetical protein
MRYKRPFFGPNAGTLVRDGEPVIEATGALEPAAYLALPDESREPPSALDRSLVGRDGAARALYDTIQRHGGDRSMSFTDCQDRVIAARTNVNRRSN